MIPNQFWIHLEIPSSHLLLIEDLYDVLTYEPEVLIVGTGADGLMKVPEKTRKFLESEGIRLITKETEEACKTYNELKDKKKVALLHLTC
jgi:hypothetical protein